jgi:predicted transcriptional regulator
MAKASPKPVTVFDAPDDEREEKAWAEGEADVEAGRTVPHAKVTRWLKSWGTATELPAPRWRKRK